MVQRETLEQWLAEDLSLEEIGRRLNRHPSTAAYWLEKHGLSAAHRAKHASKGGPDPQTLEQLVADGNTVREIATKLSRSPSTIRYWLKFHGLQTARSARLRAGGRPPNPASPDAELRCDRHGVTRHVLRDGRYRCSRCNSDSVSRFRRTVKLKLVDQAGGACSLCGYSRCVAALQFHHVDPATKRFALSTKGLARAWDVVQGEARKCVLLCANCHAEVEAGAARLPANRFGRG